MKVFLRVFILSNLWILFSHGVEKVSTSSSSNSSNSSKSFKNSIRNSYLNPSTNSTSLKPYDSDLNFSMGAFSSENQNSRSDIFNFEIDYLLNYKVNPFIKFKINPLLTLQSGHVQSVDANSKLANKLAVKNAVLYLEWMKESYLGVGILDQSTIFSELFTDSYGFVTGQIKQSVLSGPWTFSLFSEASIPNSESAVTEQKEKESTPLLSSVGVSSSWKPTSSHYTTAKVLYFKYSQIPTSISTESVNDGNTADDHPLSATERTFKYDYEGIDSQLKFKRQVLPQGSILGGFSFIENQGAPKDLNQAYRYGGGVGINLPHRQELVFSSYYYRVESDSVISSYANPDYFRTNHLGYQLITTWNNFKEHFRVSFYYNEGHQIVENPTQSDEKIYYLRFEVLNVPI